MAAKQPCKHDGCHCPIPSDRADGYCSDYCKQHEGQAGHQRHDCSCGHASCRKG